MKKFKGLLSSNNDFVDYVSHKKREREIQICNDRINSLQNAKSILESSPVYRMKKKEFKDIQTFCRENNWTDEDILYFLTEFESKKIPSETKSSSSSAVLSQMSKVGNAFFVA